MNLRATTEAAARGLVRAVRWLASEADDVITSAKGKVNKDDLKAVAAKLGPRLITVGAAAKATGAAATVTLGSIVRETLVQEDVFLAAMALIGAILWSLLEVIGRHRSGPTEAPTPDTQPPASSPSQDHQP